MPASITDAASRLVGVTGNAIGDGVGNVRQMEGCAPCDASTSDIAAAVAVPACEDSDLECGAALLSRVPLLREVSALPLGC